MADVIVNGWIAEGGHTIIEGKKNKERPKVLKVPYRCDIYLTKNYPQPNGT